ncbi:MAG: glycoside hydrolase family 3 C-terminal domain-containing protein [Gammaproteobacteria bacterium]|nr:glycoside hydrolase family 3 C-terminal domain-containing protein [Gammaproteobacteria bacterium]
MNRILALGITAGAVLLGAAGWPAASPDPDARAAATLARMTTAERNLLLHGPMALPLSAAPLPAGAVPGAGYIRGIERLGVPALKETDASLGVAYAMGARQDGATALPSGMAMAATWDPELLRAGGVMIGAEARAKGFNVMLAGGVNLMREPRNGRSFEYLGEDPWLAGTLAGAAVAGIQSQRVISTVKHFALNDQETGRMFIDARIGDAAARESDLLAFQLAIERGQPGAVMCAYNRINGTHACSSDYLLNQVLKRDWGYPGWVMSDWGAVHGVEDALHGLDQQSGEQIDQQVYFGQPLAEAAAGDPRYAQRVNDMNRRILRSIYTVGVDAAPPVDPRIDFQAHAAVAERVARAGIVLLRNERGTLPLAADVKRIAVIGGYADSGVLSGAGSSQVQGEGGAALARPYGGTGPFTALMAESYHRSVPLAAIRARAPQARVTYRNGRYLTDAVTAAKQADVAIVFATQWMSEGLDVPDLNLPDGQDALIAAVAAANPRTIVVLETGGPVLMPWLGRTAAVLEAWYPGARGAEAIAAVLFGDENPSGRLPATFPASLDQLPRPVLDGADSVEPDFVVQPEPGQVLAVDYDIEGSDVGYRWFARRGLRPLFPFGFGLSYTTFATGPLELTAGRELAAECRVTNTGARAGAEVVQVYLVSEAGRAVRRLVGYQRVMLAPGETRSVRLMLDVRLIGRWSGAGWRIAPGRYGFAVGRSAEDLAAPVEIVLREQRRGP